MKKLLFTILFIIGLTSTAGIPVNAAITNLKISRINGTTIKIKWDKNKGYDGYYVYRYDKVAKQYVIIKKIRNNKNSFYLDTNTNANQKQYYMVKGYKGKKFTAKSKIQWKGLTKRTYIAHKGAMDIAPENTLIAFDEAAKLGYGAWECDIWYTNSKDVIIFHDGNLQNICKVNLPVTSVSKKNRSNYPVYAKNYENHATQYMPTLEETLRTASKLNMNVYLHYRTKKSQTPVSGLNKIVKLIKKYKMQNKAFFFTNKFRDIKNIQGKGIQVGYISRKTTINEMKYAAKVAGRYKCDFIIFPYNKSISMPKSFIKYCHKKNLKTINYGVTSSNQVKLLIENGSDGWISNFPVFVK